MTYRTTVTVDGWSCECGDGGTGMSAGDARSRAALHVEWHNTDRVTHELVDGAR